MAGHVGNGGNHSKLNIKKRRQISGYRYGSGKDPRKSCEKTTAERFGTLPSDEAVDFTFKGSVSVQVVFTQSLGGTKAGNFPCCFIIRPLCRVKKSFL